MDIVFLSLEGRFVKNTNLVKTFLPDRSTQVQFLSRPEGKTAFDKVDRAFDRHARFDREQEVEMIRHYYKRVEQEFPCSAVVLKRLDE